MIDYLNYCIIRLDLYSLICLVLFHLFVYEALVTPEPAEALVTHELAEAQVTPDLAEAPVPHELVATPVTPDLAEAPVPIEPTEPC